ncbi:fe-S protein assembly co-chaperone HscB [Candidatus Neoehrlichia lotoris str. RAC413]|uniref:Fe-S protein assembly co-chaperone HscB n=2 Tax=Candidatus Neoehrlichia procyonis TaxID=467750 RepID=A0A0F3NM06_9RICK|nr:fe-S protein assembly co-chaperone HscB [Candidatus Neoehrlichia lotoris str. RAC413]
MSENYFSLLQLNICFSIDLKLLEQNYITIQRAYHPDCFSSQSDKKLALEYISKINKAYQVLKSPLSRAEYILQLKNIKLSSYDDQCIIKEVFQVQESSTNLHNEILACIQNIENFFSKNDLYEAAKQTNKLKYLSKGKTYAAH